MTDEDIVRESRTTVPPTRLTDRVTTFGKVSWGAIWAGTMVTIGMEALFITFGLFIAGVFGGSPAWSIAWFLVTMAVSFYVGARTTARLSGAPSPELAMLNGLAGWGLAILATVVIGIAVTTVLAANSGPASPLAGLDWGSVELWFGSFWGGVVLSLLTAYSGARVQPNEPIAAGVAVGAESSAASRRRVAG